MNQEVDAKNEMELANLLKSNNSLEKSYLKLLYNHIHKDRPIQIRNIFARVEEEAFRNDIMLNSDILSGLIDKEKNDFASIQDEIERATAAVEDQRQDLRKIIREIDTVVHSHEDNSTPIEEPDKKCSKAVEDLVREIAYKIDDVEEDDLIQYLARGPAHQTEQDVLDNTKKLCQKRYELKQLTTMQKILKDLDDRITSLKGAEDQWEREINPNNHLFYDYDLLSDKFDEAAANISKIKSEEESDENSEIEKKWKQLQQLSNEIKDSRTQLFNSIRSESEIPLPKEFTQPEREKAALEQTLNSLIESNRLLTEYLQEISKHGINDSVVLSPEEVREILYQYNELKQKNLE